jgi:hypothetical protein
MNLSLYTAISSDRTRLSSTSINKHNSTMEKTEIAHAEPVSTQPINGEDAYIAEQPFREHEPLLDLEGQYGGKQELAHRATEPAASRTKTFVFLAAYFLMNLSLTFYNKAVMGSVCSTHQIGYNHGANRAYSSHSHGF